MAKNRNIKMELVIDETVLENVEIDAIDSLWLTAEALRTDIVQAQLMPRDSGHMQNKATRTQKTGKAEYRLLTDTPYAKWVYFNPENKQIHKEKNPNARDHWLEPYISGDKRNYINDTFVKITKMKGGNS